jgi:ribose transport system permease protein
MTLAMMQIGAGICAIAVRGQIAYAVPNLVKTLGSESLGPVPWIVIIAALTLAIGHFVLTYTRFGRYVYMTGGNREAAEYAGINVRGILSAVMIISAMCSGVAGMLGVAYRRRLLTGRAALLLGAVRAQPRRHRDAAFEEYDAVVCCSQVTRS